jgi:hypothetical protein
MIDIIFRDEPVCDFCKKPVFSVDDRFAEMKFIEKERPLVMCSDCWDYIAQDS